MKNIAVIGHIDHGKTTLISAISKVFGTERINCSGNEKEILSTETKLDFGGEEYLFFDYPNDRYYEENLTGNEDGAALVVSATDEPMPGTEKAVALCEKLGIEKLVVFTNMCDLMDDDDLIDFVEMDVRDMLYEYGMDPDITFIRGSARMAGMGYSGEEYCIGKLVDAVAGQF